MAEPSSPFWRRFWGAYLLLLALSTAVRWARHTPPVLGRDKRVVVLPAMQGWDSTADSVRFAYREAGPADAPRIILLHGSPGSSADVWALGRLLADSFHVVAPDLIGFGNSSLEVPDHSLVAQAAYVRALMDRLGWRDAHVIGFSLGGGVAEELAARAPARVRSLTLLSAIGVQEFELLGDYHLNHALHGGQLVLFWAMENLVPHFGAWDGGMLTAGYTRSFYDSDQRPLRAALLGWQGPALVLHGVHDPLVPLAAAEENARLLPQSEVVLLDSDHFMTFAAPHRLVGPITAFVRRVEAGAATIRASADPKRVAAARLPFDAHGLPSAQGFSLVIALTLLALATLISEDLACVAAGVLAARGSLPLVPAIVACYVGIVVGDQLLYLLGRTVGRAIVRIPPVSWWLSEKILDRASVWFEKQGLRVVLTSRLIPGTRFPTYVAAGILRAGFLRFAGYLAIAGAIWTPGLVGASYLAAKSGRPLVDALPGASWPWAIGGVLVLALLVRFLTGLTTHRGRRMAYGLWLRWSRWEFWPMWLFYPPVVFYVLWLGLKHRSLTLFTAADPAIPSGGLVGESKGAILAALGAGDPRVAVTRTIPGGLPLTERLPAAERLMAESGLAYPLICKPDVGERGNGVALIAGREALGHYLDGSNGATLLQEYVMGEEFGVFYWRLPSEARGRIFSVTTKRLPATVGDGVRTLEQLILDDDRLVAQAPIFLRRLEDRLDEIPAAGARVSLGARGNHCQGALFLDGRPLVTPALEATIDGLAKRFAGFYVGRFDLRAPSVAAFQRGENLVVIELNGVTSEATHIYDPALGLFAAWRTLAEQWRIIFQVAAETTRSGARVTPLPELLRLLWVHRRRAGGPDVP